MWLKYKFPLKGKLARFRGVSSNGRTAVSKPMVMGVSESLHPCTLGKIVIGFKR